MFYRVSGFDYKKHFDVVVDVNDTSLVEDEDGNVTSRAHHGARKIAANPDICFHMSMNLSGTEAGVIEAEPALIGVLLEAGVLDQKFETARKLARKEWLAKRRQQRKLAATR